MYYNLSTLAGCVVNFFDKFLRKSVLSPSSLIPRVTRPCVCILSKAAEECDTRVNARFPEPCPARARSRVCIYAGCTAKNFQIAVRRRVAESSPRIGDGDAVCYRVV